MNKLSPILILIGLTATSCANWIDNEDFPEMPDAVTLSRHELTMLVGDTCRLSASFTPEDYDEQSLLWTATDDDILNIEGNTIVARQAGKANVVITSAIGLKTDTCRVVVQPAWGAVKPEQYDMVVYAALDPALDPEEVEVGAFWEGTLKGRGEVHTAHGITYTAIRIYSPMMSSEMLDVPITFRCHLRKEGRVEHFTDTIYFDGEAHGTLSNLYRLSLD